ncbi:MAG: nucleotidyltransferase [Caldilineaceae bacterium]
MLYTLPDWAEIEAEEAELLRALSPAEGLVQFLALQREFEPWLQETEPFFRQERNDALLQLQANLQKLNERQLVTMDTLLASLVVLQKRLEEAGLPSMAIGGLVVGLWGEPRLTRDVDVKVLATRADRKRLLALLHDYAPLNADADAALQRNAVAFFQDHQGTRLDIMLADNLFDETALGRAKQVEVQAGQFVRVCSAEDLIIYKMISVRTKDRADVEGIIRRQRQQLDDRYIEKWLREFEQALDDSTLVNEYRRLRQRFA